MTDAYRGEGNAISWTNNTGATVTAGDVIVVGDTVMVAKSTIAAAALGALYVQGVHEIAAEGDTAWAVGDWIYWDTYLEEGTKTASSYPRVGICTEVKAAAAVLGHVELEQHPGA